MESIVNEVPSRSRAKKIDVAKAAKDFDKHCTLETMKTKEGRRVVWRVLFGSGFFTLSFTANSETFFREGRRSIGKQLYDELKDLCPDLYTLMENENTKKETSNV